MWGRNQYDRPSGSFGVFAVASTVLVGASSYWIYQCVSEYGWDGTLRYIWEGDPYPDRIRDYIETLDSVEKSVGRSSTLLSSLEEGLERAGLDSIDDSSSAAILKTWETNTRSQDLQKQLAKLSYDLDNFAAKVDQVILTAEDQADIKRRKKTLSKRIVDLMERTDCLVAFHQKAKGFE